MVANGKATFKVTGRAGVPAGVRTVALTVTALNAKAAGAVRVWADGAARPAIGTLNFVPGQSVSNLVYAPVGGDGSIILGNYSSGSLDLVADVAGYFVPGAASLPGTFVRGGRCSVCWTPAPTEERRHRR